MVFAPWLVVYKKYFGVESVVCGERFLAGLDELTDFNSSKVRFEVSEANRSGKTRSNFNSSKVRFEGWTRLGSYIRCENFNSSKVRFEGGCVRYCWRGYRISIPLRCDLKF